MKILWVNPNFLHPTTKGGQIRTLEMLRCLERRHEIHYLAFEAEPEGPRRAGEYAARAYGVKRRPPAKGTVGFGLQLVGSLFDELPLAARRWKSDTMLAAVRDLAAKENFDLVVADFLFSATNMDSLEDVVLFQHNVETMIWRRQAENARGAIRRKYFGAQAAKMERFEREVCSKCAHVVAVSEADARMFAEFGAKAVSWVETGVNVEMFRPPDEVEPRADLVFVGSMDWSPNVDGVSDFLRRTWPLIREKRPDCSLAVVGRRPGREIYELAEKAGGVEVTGTVDDVRPYLWGAKVSIVPLRIGGGTRLKIYESMAARAPVVSTAIGAEGLRIDPPRDIRIADEPEAFAARCLELLDDADERRRIADAAFARVEAEFTWERVTEPFERTLVEVAARSKPPGSAL